MSEYSVLMSVYRKEKASFLNDSILSILNQSIKTNDFVIVCDGPLTPELDAVIEKYSKSPVFHIVRLPENKGLGNALKTGLPMCKNEFVLRMDSDDLSLPNRAELQIKELENGVDIVGGYITEFEDNPNNIIGVREVPLSKDDIYNYCKKRSPFNHPSVAFRKSSILSVGGYIPLLYVEDWYLWTRCVLGKLNSKNIPNVLVNMRSGYLMRARRGGKDYKKNMVWLFRYMYKNHYISFFRKEKNIWKYRIYSALPLRIKAHLTLKYLRKTQ